jgi:hypothetical protein
MAETKKVKKNDLVVVYGSEKSKSLETGKAYKVHRELAKNLVKKGEASVEAPKGKAVKGGKAEGETEE